MLKTSCRCHVYISAFNQRVGYLKQMVLERTLKVFTELNVSKAHLKSV